FQIGANSGNTLGVTLSGVRSEDLGDVKTLNSINSAITGGAKTIDVGNRTGVNYNASVDTAFDLRDAINSAGGNITASIKNGKLRLESSAAVGTVFANDGGALASTLFATNATVNTVDATTSLWLFPHKRGASVLYVRHHRHPDKLRLKHAGCSSSYWQR
ncbi:MAG: hypothetical protein EBT00_17255, partial [Proteobacteria bacterium]|nr:hypothetical protein [Pseudomonadota bacterium]